VAGPGRFEIAAGIAFAMSLALVIVGRALGTSLKFLEVVDLAYFSVMVLAAIIGSDGTVRWLETWAGELSNITLAVFALATLAIGQPFTIQYAREETPREYWDSPVFLHINQMITAVWAGAFVVAAIAGAFGDLVLDNSNNLWTGWVIQVGAIIVAIAFTGWYPEVGQARAAQAAGQPADPPPPLAALLLPLSGWVPVVGILILVFGSGPWYLGVALIIAGSALSHALHRATRSPPTPKAAS